MMLCALTGDRRMLRRVTFSIVGLAVVASLASFPSPTAAQQTRRAAKRQAEANAPKPAEKPAAEKPTPEKPTVEKPGEKPAAEKPAKVVDSPVAKATPVEKIK